MKSVPPMTHHLVSSAYHLIVDTRDSLTLIFKKPVRSWREKLRLAYDVGRWIMKLPTSDAPETPIVQHMRSPQRVDAILDRKVPASPRDVN